MHYEKPCDLTITEHPAAVNNGILDVRQRNDQGEADMVKDSLK